MPIQTDALVMVALGVKDDAPPVSIQPRLVDGIHLRWAFPRDRGFPWYGYYLFRRSHEFRGERCLGEELIALGVGPLPDQMIELPIGRVSSDANLALTDDFSPAGVPELDLGGRTWLRFDFPAGDPVFRIDLSVGCRGQAETRLRCIRLDTVKPKRSRGVLIVDGIKFGTVENGPGSDRARPSPFVHRQSSARRVGGLEITGSLEISLEKPVTAVEAVATILAGNARLEALDHQGRVISAETFALSGPGKNAKARLRTDRPFVRCRLVAIGGQLVLHRFCHSILLPIPTAIRLEALDGTMVVASKMVRGDAGDVISETLTADRITALRIAGGPAALIGMCVRPVAFGSGDDWSPVPECPQPITLPIVHPDYPAARGPEDLPAARQAATDRIVYGPRSPWAAEFDTLHTELRALVKGGAPPGPPGRAMADPARAAAQVPGISGTAAPNVPDPHLRSIHPLDLVVTGALHPPIAQMVGLYWADRTADPNATYDYLVVADHHGQGRGSWKRLLAALQKDFSLSDGWICFARRARAEPPVPPPRDVRAYALPGASFRAPGPAGDPVAQCAGNIGLTWADNRDDLGYLRPGAPIFYHVWRDRQGNGATPGPSAEATEHATARGPILIKQQPGIQLDPPSYPGDWPPFSMPFLDFALTEGWYGYQVNAVDLFGRFSPKSSFAEWRQWSPAPNPKPWYYLDPPADRQIHPGSVRIRDTEAPPPPTAVEAWALDPDDPMLVRDQAYTDWRATLPGAVRDSLIGLRVRWRWTVAQQRQAPDTAEFRVYWEPSSNPPLEWRDAASWNTRCHVAGYNQSVTVEPNGDRVYQAFLPVAGTGDPFAAGVPLAPTRADPIVYGQITVTAADDASDAADRWQGVGRWAARTGNEGRTASPVRVFRVYRVRPMPPEAVVDGGRVYATPADWHGHSFYSFRWKPAPDLWVHVHRAMDESVFLADWSKRPRTPLDPNDLGRFPDPVAEPTWNAAKRAQVADALNAFNDLASGGANRTVALRAYRALNDDALRVLANFPDLEKAFTQLTLQPLDPADPATADRRGPDDPGNYLPRPALRWWLDQLDGKATNRYLYRASYVDRVQNRSALGAVGTPVRLPNVVSPRPPAAPKAESGDRRVVLKWPSNREDDLLEYRVFRADSADAARDLRSMTAVAVVPADPDPGARPPEVTWTDEPLRGLTDRWYRIVAVDRVDPIDPRGGGGNVSKPSEAVKGRAFDTAPPVPPTPNAAWTGPAGAEIAGIRWSSQDETRLQARELPSGFWTDLGGWLAPGAQVVDWNASDPTFSYEFRVWARKYTGAIAVGPTTRLDQV